MSSHTHTHTHCTHRTTGVSEYHCTVSPAHTSPIRTSYRQAGTGSRPPLTRPPLSARLRKSKRLGAWPGGANGRPHRMHASARLATETHPTPPLPSTTLGMVQQTPPPRAACCLLHRPGRCAASPPPAPAHCNVHGDTPRALAAARWTTLSLTPLSSHPSPSFLAPRSLSVDM